MIVQGHPVSAVPFQPYETRAPGPWLLVERRGKVGGAGIISSSRPAVAVDGHWEARPADRLDNIT
ncbi:hypothetical protein SAMD00023353_1102460 [Rosellinia necatrix]|uniref:Uncharacterized protein n=1 Tax=Rosellinia necatrix TaxID=77044 RepID=A0A1S8A6T2_ROSNE|nr:hypothetical protein SAMD00023353_1102460 [Rosellinia necatrix]